jgi:fructoselysine-6-P-deglycase FrlB-like protein
MSISDVVANADEAADWAEHLAGKRVAFLGCGDSLAAARPTESLGHRVVSAGDVAWGLQPPAGVDACVALSWSGRTGATVRAAEVAKAHGQEVWAITSDPSSPLANLAARHLQVPHGPDREDIPSWGFAVHSQAVLAITGGGFVRLPDVQQAAQRLVTELESTALPRVAPSGITITTLPDSYAAAEFWSLKFIEATGVSTRVVPLEETGHVDYFIGPQDHLVLIPLVATGHERAARLGDALARNGHTLLTLDLSDTEPDLTLDEFRLALSIAGSTFAGNAARTWGRVPFRGGAVDMSARHIQVPA